MSSKDQHHTTPVDPLFDQPPDQPNGPEVTGTSFPLLATVLAGFAITIAVQLILHPSFDEPSFRLNVVLVAFLLSTLMFVSSIGFALNAQANNYLPFLDLGDVGSRLLNVSDRTEWVRQILQRWAVYFAAALFSFYLGVFLLLAGLNLMVWEFVSGMIAGILFIAILVNVAIVFYLQRNIDDIAQNEEAIASVGSRMGTRVVGRSQMGQADDEPEPDGPDERT